MTNKQMKKIIEEQAESMRNNEIQINIDSMVVSVESPSSSSYSFQGDEYHNLMAEAEKASEKFDVSEEDYILWYLNSAIGIGD